MSDTDEPARQSRIKIIETVQTPLGFFVLVVLIVDGALAGFVLSLGAGPDRTFSIYAMIALIGILVLIVAGLAVWRPGILTGKDARHSLLIGPPLNLKEFDIRVIDWDETKCFFVCGDRKKQIKLVPSREGQTFRADVPARFLERAENEPASLRLCDLKSNEWEVRNFYVFENLVHLSLRGNMQKMIDDYGGDDQ